MSKRTDIHRPGAIIPADYTYVFSFNLSTTSDGWPVPSFGINCELDRRVYNEKREIVKNGEHDANGRCCIIGLRNAGFNIVGAPGKCGVCGVNFVYGDVWEHKDGDMLIVGHICADKYALLVNRSAWELEHDRRVAASARVCQAAANEEKRAAFLAENPGLADAFERRERHYILGDLYHKFLKYCDLSPKQVALALKIVAELTAPKAEEKHVPAPVGGRVTFEGEVVSIKSQPGYAYGTTDIKMLVKVPTPEGCWVCWSTVPSAIMSDVQKGSRVRVTATLQAGKDAHFCFGKRPSAILLDSAAA